jgi:hypothetical protein
MQHRKRLLMLMAAGLLMAVASVIALASAQPAQAQCGSQASSCKNCHEVQAKDPVNNDGNPWHVSHAFGDFCYVCHGGNSQATDETAAHSGMVAPLSDIQAACQQCHPGDLQARAQVYASALGVEIGAGGDATPAPTPDTSNGSTAETTASQPASNLSVSASLSPNDANLVDYVQRYNQIALGKGAANWGNVILLVLIGSMLVGGGGLVLYNEKLINISFRETRPVQAEYPLDVVEMLPQISRLKPNARRSLRRLLEKPEVTAEVLTSLDRLAGGDLPSNPTDEEHTPAGSAQED